MRVKVCENEAEGEILAGKEKVEVRDGQMDFMCRQNR